jgi:ankyrin repeat protein
VLVVAEPGMGKSSTTTNVAWHTKQRDSTSWVLRVNWNDHTRKLQEINVDIFNFNSLVAFLYSASFPESKYTDFNMSLLKQALQNSGNITVLMDGFDEITPIHTEKAAVILSELMKTKVGKVWVTSRPVERERLEKELSVPACSMKHLSTECQQEMLRKLWKSKASGREYKLDTFIHDLLFNTDLSVPDQYFTGSPLYIVMVATVYAMEMEKCLNSENTIERNIDLVNFYKKFVETKLEIYITEKEKADLTNASVQISHERLKKSFLKYFEACALVAILPSEMLKSLHNTKIERKTQRFLRDVQDGKDNTGIVINVVEGKPLFVHRTFAEYFTAHWFSKNFELNRNVMEHILFDFKYSFVTEMLNGMLTSHHPLHRAVLEWDEERLETLLRDGHDVNAVDNGGRTVMHLIPGHDTRVLNIVNEFSKHEVSLDNTDNVLQWSPLQYAIKFENWFFVERLLESNVDRIGLDMIRHRVHDPDYLGQIITQAARFGHLLFLEYLCSIGVDIHQASSEDFPSPLYAAVESKDLQVVKCLIQHGADCNTRYSDGQTPLFHAVTEGSLDIVRELVEERGASLEVCDDQGRTAIDWANDYVWDPEKYTPLLWKGDVDRVKEIVNYLREKRCKESSSVCQNNDT